MPLWEWTFSFCHHSFTPFCLPIHPLWGFISIRVPSIPRSCQDSLEFGPCLQGQTLVPVRLNAAHLKQKDPWNERGINNCYNSMAHSTGVHLVSSPLQSENLPVLWVFGSVWLSWIHLKLLARGHLKVFLCTSEALVETGESIWLLKSAIPSWKSVQPLCLGATVILLMVIRFQRCGNV